MRTPRFTRPPQRPLVAPRRGRYVPGALLLAAIGTVIVGGMAARYGLSWPRRLCRPQAPGVIIHHSASPGAQHGQAVDAALIDRWHQREGWGQETAEGAYHIGYHYVILPDGGVQPGRPEWMRGAHAVGYNDHIGICIIGNFSSSANPDCAIKPARPTPQQLDALHELLIELMATHHFGPEEIRRHRDVAQTACPGDRFPFDRVLDRLRAAGARPRQ